MAQFRTTHHQFTLRMIVNDTDEMSLHDLKESFTSIIITDLLDIFCNTVDQRQVF